MADNTAKQDLEQADGNESAGQPAVQIGLLMWLIMITIIVLLSSSGFVLGRLLARSGPSEAAAPAAGDSPAGTQDAAGSRQDTWFFNELESVVVNPNEPGATRYVRVGLILEISSSMSQDKAKAVIESKKPLLINWLNLYFKGLSLSEMETDKDISRILSQICDGFNEILWPDGKPQIKKILIREFNIQ